MNTNNRSRKGNAKLTVDRLSLAGYPPFHNYMRLQMALEGKTPAAGAAGIEIRGENKWLTLIQNAEKTTKGLAQHVII